MKKQIDHEAEEASRIKHDAVGTAAWKSAVYEPCPFCGTQPLAAQKQGVWCNNDDCPIVGTVFSGGARQWNKRASPAQAQLFDTGTLSADAADAERYRRLREGNDYSRDGAPMVVLYDKSNDDGTRPFWGLGGAALDSVVDAAETV